MSKMWKALDMFLKIQVLGVGDGLKTFQEIFIHKPQDRLGNSFA